MSSNDHDVAEPDPKRNVLWVIGATAGGIGLATAGGSIVDGTGTSAGFAEALPRALVGAIAGLAVAGLAAWWSTTRRPAWASDRQAIGTVVIVAVCLGALLGAGSTPGEPSDDALVGGATSDSGAAVYRTRSGETADGIVSPVDLDGDGVADVVNSRAVLGYDADGDGIEDGRLRRCESDLGFEIEPGSVAINGNCSNSVEELLPYDAAVVLATNAVAEPVPLPRRDRGPAGFTDTQGTVILLTGLALVLGAMVFLARQVDHVPIEAEALFLEGREFIDDEGDEDAKIESLATALARSLSSLTDSHDPRDSILAAYVRLLDELELVGLGRHAWEGPMEHCRRCLSDARLPAGPIDALVELFAEARFGTRRMTEADRDRAHVALTASVDLLRQHPVLAAGATT